MTLREWMTRLDDRLDRVELSLNEHMRRTAAAEQQLEVVRAEMAPLKAHVAMWAGAAKALAVAGALVGLAVGVLQLVR